MCCEGPSLSAVRFENVRDERFLGVPEHQVLPEVLTVGTPEHLLATPALPASDGATVENNMQVDVEPDHSIGHRPANILLHPGVVAGYDPGVGFNRLAYPFTEDIAFRTDPVWFPMQGVEFDERYVQPLCHLGSERALTRVRTADNDDALADTVRHAHDPISGD